jgi:hypothetical protein
LEKKFPDTKFPHGFLKKITGSFRSDGNIPQSRSLLLHVDITLVVIGDATKKIVARDIEACHVRPESPNLEICGPAYKQKIIIVKTSVILKKSPKGGGWRVEGGGWRVEGGGWRVEGGGWRVEGGGRREEGGENPSEKKFQGFKGIFKILNGEARTFDEGQFGESLLGLLVGFYLVGNIVQVLKIRKSHSLLFYVFTLK